MAEINKTKRQDAASLVYYILLKDATAIKSETNVFSSKNKDKCVPLLQGEILCRNIPTAVDNSSGGMRLHLCEKPSVYLDCLLKDIEKIDEQEAKLLLGINTMRERFNLYKDKKALETGKKMSVGSDVYVTIQSQELKGTIRYKGSLLGENSTMFGIELTEGAGKGTTNGFFRGDRYFSCNTDCGIFVSLEKLRLCEDNKTSNSTGDERGLLSKANKKVKEFIFGKPSHEENPHEEQEKKIRHKIDDRVWVFIKEKLCGGYMKYIGRVPGYNVIFAGVELDEPEGLGYGEYDGKNLFRCQMDHAHFCPIANVISQEKYEEMNCHSNKVPPGEKKDASLATHTSEDIVNMESQFSKQSSADVIKEQEQLLKQIKQQRERNQGRHLGENGIGPSLDECLTNEKQSELKNHVSHATLQMNTQRVSKGEPVLSSFMKNKLDIGSMVQVLTKHDNPIYGVIRWLGFLPDSDKKIAGLELEEELAACSDGTFNGRRYFECPSRRGFFVHLHNCTPDSRFNRNSMENPANKRLTGIDFGPYESPTIEDDFIPPPETLEVYLEKGPRGIQGHHNSCYLDATLFGAFAFSSVMDSILLRPRDETDIEQYEKVQNVLRNNIVSPLRDSGFVRADRVLELRQLLDQLGTVTGLVGEEKDPEEFLLTLLQQVLKSEPFLKIKSGKEVRNEYCYQVLADRDVERVLPSVEELLKRSFHQSDLKLTEVPSCLIVQMPRFGKGFKMYDRILPSLTINIGELVENSPQDCAVCGRLALFHCRDCFSVTGNDDRDSSGNYCKDCNERVHSHVKRAQHSKPRPIAVSRDIRASYANHPVEHREMELFAVICIETSHYVTFAKCGQPGGVMRWCFFDSMADRVGTKNGYNVPSVSECPEVIEWLSSEKQNRERIINTSDKEMPDRVRRILGDAYVCLYESKEMAMYK